MLVFALLVVLSVGTIRLQPNSVLLVSEQRRFPHTNVPVALATVNTTGSTLSKRMPKGARVPAGPARVAAGIDCAKLGSVPPRVHFKQFYSHSLGEISMRQMRDAAKDIAELADSIEAKRSGLDLFIQDGTLMSAMRWGQAVNDNDVEFGFRFASLSSNNVTGHYFELFRLFVAAGIMDAPTPRLMRKMWQLTGVPKQGRCQMRPQLMQCRHRNGVMIDIFGPWTVFTPATKLTIDHVLPVKRCRMFDFDMPCPRDPIHALKSFTLEHGAAGDRKSTWFEFGTCPLLPVRAEERDQAHIDDILRMSYELLHCGYPSLYEDRHDVSCAAVFRDAGVVVPP